MGYPLTEQPMIELIFFEPVFMVSQWFERPLIIHVPEWCVSGLKLSSLIYESYSRLGTVIVVLLPFDRTCKVLGFDLLWTPERIPTVLRREIPINLNPYIRSENYSETFLVYIQENLPYH